MIMKDADAIQQLFDFDYNIQFIDMNNIPETVCPNADGSYTIFVNSKLTVERQQESALHALFHILQNDFEKNDVDVIEQKAHENDKILKSYHV